MNKQKESNMEIECIEDEDGNEITEDMVTMADEDGNETLEFLCDALEESEYLICSSDEN